MHINVTLRRVRVTVVGVTKQQVVHILSALSVTLDIQYEARMRHIVLSSVACSSVRYFFPYYFINGTTVGGGTFTELKMRVLIFSTFIV